MSSSGSRFAQLQLEKYGWKEGKGLGREEGGITKALKPKLKFDSAGLGHDIAHEYKFHWWDHAFNKAAENIKVEKDQDGTVQLIRKEELLVSKKKSSHVDNKAKFYGAFVKGGTLVGEKEKKEHSESEESEDERDISLPLTDEELFKICGKRTAHKGARHGLTMSAKLARVAEQERLLMEKWTASSEHFKEESCKSEAKENKKKKKQKAKKYDIPEMYVKQMDATELKKKKVKEYVNEEPFVSTKDVEENLESCKRKTLKRYSHYVTDSPLDCAENGSFVDSSCSQDLLMGHIQPTHLQSNDINKYSNKNKKNKRKSKTFTTVDADEYTGNGTDVLVEDMKNKKKNKATVTVDVSEYILDGTEGKAEGVKEKKTKKKKCLDKKEKCAEETEIIEENSFDKKKKKKKDNGTVYFHSESVPDGSIKKKKYKYADGDGAQQMEDHELPDVPHRKKKKER